MAQFDASTWRSRASRRFGREHRAGRRDAAARYTRSVAAIGSIGTVIGWCLRRGVGVRFNRAPGVAGQGGEYDPNARVIAIDAALSRELQLFTLLHEVGHFLVGPLVTTVAGRRPKRYITYRVDVVADELAAWKRGFDLAQELGLHLDERRYNKARSVYVKDYMAWALRANGYGEGL